MAKIIRQQDIYDINIYAPLIKDTTTLINLHIKLGKILQEDAKKVSKMVGDIDTKTAKGIQRLSELEKTSADLIRSKNKLDKDALNLKKQLSSRTDKEVAGKIRLQKIDKLQRDTIKDRLILQDREAGTLDKLNARNRILRRERSKLNLETTKGQATVK